MTAIETQQYEEQKPRRTQRSVALKPSFEPSNKWPHHFYTTMSGEHLAVQSATKQRGSPSGATRVGRGAYSTHPVPVCACASPLHNAEAQGSGYAAQHNATQEAHSLVTHITYTTHGPCASRTHSFSHVRARTHVSSSSAFVYATPEQKKKYTFSSSQFFLKKKQCFPLTSPPLNASAVRHQ